MRSRRRRPTRAPRRRTTASRWTVLAGGGDRAVEPRRRAGGMAARPTAAGEDCGARRISASCRDRVPICATSWKGRGVGNPRSRRARPPGFACVMTAPGRRPRCRSRAAVWRRGGRPAETRSADPSVRGALKLARGTWTLTAGSLRARQGLGLLLVTAGDEPRGDAPLEPASGVWRPSLSFDERTAVGTAIVRSGSRWTVGGRSCAVEAPPRSTR